MRRASDTLDPWASDTPTQTERASDARARRDGNLTRIAVRGASVEANVVRVGLTGQAELELLQYSPGVGFSLAGHEQDPVGNISQRQSS